MSLNKIDQNRNSHAGPWLTFGIYVSRCCQSGRLSSCHYPKDLHCNIPQPLQLMLSEKEMRVSDGKNEQKVIKIESQQCKVVALLSTNLAFFVMAMG